MTTAPEIAPTALLQARFESAGGKTQLAHCLATAPLKIAKTFALDEGIGACVMDCSPGLLAGDFYRFEWDLAENARVLVTTQGFTRVHPSQSNPCRLEQKIRLQRGAFFEWFPEPTMLYRDAALRTEFEVEMAADATLLWGEIVAAGRVGRGEAFAFHSLQSRLRVRREGRLIFVSHSALRPASFAPERLGAWGGFTHQGTFAVFGDEASQALQTAFREILEQNSDVWGGASRLEAGGLVVSLFGRRAHDLQEIIRALREAARGFMIRPLAQKN